MPGCTRQDIDLWQHSHYLKDDCIALLQSLINHTMNLNKSITHNQGTADYVLPESSGRFWWWGEFHMVRIKRCQSWNPDVWMSTCALHIHYTALSFQEFLLNSLLESVWWASFTIVYPVSTSSLNVIKYDSGIIVYCILNALSWPCSFLLILWSLLDLEWIIELDVSWFRDWTIRAIWSVISSRG